MSNNTRIFVVFLAALVGLQPLMTLAKTYIVRDGQPMARIVTAENPTRMQKLAAAELQKYIEKISGARLAITNVPGDDLPIKIYVGKSPFTDKLGLDDKGLDHGAYIMKSGPDHLALLGKDTDYFQGKPGSGGEEYPSDRSDRARSIEAWIKKHGNRWGSPFLSSFKGYHAGLGLWANDEHGSLNAVNDFLRSLGVEWYMPGDFGEVLPQMKSITLPEVDRTVRPEVASRWMGFYGNAPFQTSTNEFLWQLRLGLNPNGGIGGHGIMYMLEPETVKKEHQDYFALYGDRRETEARGGKPCCCSTGLMESSLGFARVMFDDYNWEYVSLMPTDGYGGCNCPLCKEMATPGRGPRGSISDCVWKFINDAGRAIEKTHPSKKISCMAYGAYSLPPEKIEKLSTNVAIGIAQGRASFYEPETRQQHLELRKVWLEKIDPKIFSIHEYYLHARPDRNWAGIPVYFPHLIAEDFRSLKGMLRGEYIEVARDFSSSSKPDEPDPALAASHLNCWLTSRFWWNPDQDVDKLLADYYDKFYGPAARQMKEFIEHCEKHWPVMNNEQDKIEKALELLGRARKAAGDGNIYARRVQLVEDYSRKPLERIVYRMTVKRAELPYTRLGDYWGGPGIKVDGKLDDHLWKHTSYANASLVECQTGREPVQTTRIQAVWAFGALHFAIHCQERDTSALNTPTSKNDDQDIFKGDHVSILLESPCHSYYEIAVAPNGAMIDIDRENGGTNIAWSSKAEVATSVGDGFWIAEIRVPVLDETAVDVDPDHTGLAGGKPNPTYPWFFNYGRQRIRPNETETSARYPTGAPGFYSTYYFGKLHVRK